MLAGVLRTLVTLGWGLWFGGLVTLFLTATAMFRAGRELGASANPVMFASFERFQLILAVAVPLLTLLWLIVARGRWKGVLLVLFLVAASAAMMSWIWISPELNELRLAQQTQTPAFRAAHGRSMMCYGLSTLLLLIGGLLLPHADRTIRT